MEEQQEIWKDIIIEKNGVIYDYTGLYQVSNFGRVATLNYKRTGMKKILKSQPNKKGYMMVRLTKDMKYVTLYVHRIVATMFIPNPDNLPVVNHLDENPGNNHVSNLEWCTQKHNVKYSDNLHPGERAEKVGNALRGRKQSEQHRSSVSEAIKEMYKQGYVNPRKGKPCTEETKQKMSITRTGKKDSDETRRKKSEARKGDKNPAARKVICIETMQIFNTVKEAKEWVGKGDIKGCLAKKIKTSGTHPETGERLHWMYYDEWLEIQEKKG